MGRCIGNCCVFCLASRGCRGDRVLRRGWVWVWIFRGGGSSRSFSLLGFGLRVGGDRLRRCGSFLWTLAAVMAVSPDTSSRFSPAQVYPHTSSTSSSHPPYPHPQPNPPSWAQDSSSLARQPAQPAKFQ